MAKKSIILSNDDGRVTFSNTSSVWIEDSDFSITGSEISGSNIKFANLSSKRLAYISGSSKLITNVINGTVDKGALVWNSTLSQWSASSDIVESYTGSAGGDLSGDFGSAEGVKVVNISNVNSGTLPAAYGGTGINTPIGNNILLVARSGSYTYLSASAASSGSVVTCTNDGWVISPPAYLPDVRFYTSGSTGNTFTWNKPAGARFARVILQGAGGGGSSGTATTNGSGGGSGGYTDITINISNYSSVSVIVGLGGSAGTTSTNIPGTSGGTTYFDTYTATGGGGATSVTVPGTAGVGITKNGGPGEAGNSTGRPATTYGMPSGGGRGNGYGPGIIIPFFSGSEKNFGYNIDSSGKTVSITIASGAYGAGGTTSNYTVASKPGFGAGGGGGLGASAYVPNTAGPGGDGYALVISW